VGGTLARQGGVSDGMGFLSVLQIFVLPELSAPCMRTLYENLLTAAHRS